MVVLVQRAAPPPTPHSPSYPTGTSRADSPAGTLAQPWTSLSHDRASQNRGVATDAASLNQTPRAARLTSRGTDGWIALRGCWDGGDVIHRHRHAPAHAHVVLCSAYAPAGLTSSVWRVPGCPWTLVLAAAADDDESWSKYACTGASRTSVRCNMSIPMQIHFIVSYRILLRCPSRAAARTRYAKDQIRRCNS